MDFRKIIESMDESDVSCLVDILERVKSRPLVFDALKECTTNDINYLLNASSFPRNKRKYTSPQRMSKPSSPRNEDLRILQSPWAKM